MINTLRKATYKYGYLLIIAAWLYTLSFVVLAYWTHYSSPKNVQEKLQKQLTAREQRFNSIAADTNFLYSLIADTSSNNINRKSLFKENFGILIYAVNNNIPSAVYWNNNHYYLNENDLNKADGNYFADYQNGNFELIKVTVPLRNNIYYVVGLIPIRWKYFIENKYLTTHFDGYPNLDKLYEITTDTNAFHIHSDEIKRELFKIKFKQGVDFTGYDEITILFRTASIFLLLLFLTMIAKELVFENGLTNGFLFLTVSFIAMRLICYLFPFPFYFTDLPLFDPSIYASNFIHPSLGDLLINSILFFWLINFYNFHYLHTSSKQNNPLKNIFLYARIFLLIITAFLFTSIIRSLVIDSKISFNVINFFSLNIYTGISFFILGLLCFSFFNLSHILLKPLYNKAIPLSHQIVAASAFGLLLLSFSINGLHTRSNLFTLLWLIIYLIFLFYRRNDLSASVVHSGAFILWLMFLAISVAALLSNQNKNVEIEQRKLLAENLITQTDPLSENLLDVATLGLSNDFLKNNLHKFLILQTNKQLKDSLIEADFLGYLNKYDTRIYTYDSSFNALFNDDSTTYGSLKNIIRLKAKPTGVSNLYSFESEGKLLNYIFEKQFLTDGKVSLALIIVIKPKLYISEAIFPELFKQSNDLSSDLNLNYAYAIYKNGKLISHFNDYNFPLQVNSRKISANSFSQKNNNGYNELWYNSFNQKQVVIAAPNNQVMAVISLFAWLFCSFLIIAMFLHGMEILFRKKFNLKAIKSSFKLSIHAQIHFNILFVSIFSFIVVAFVTISFFIIRFDKSNQEKLFRSIQIVGYEIQSKLDANPEIIAATAFQRNNLENSLEKIVDEIAQTHNTDITIFNAQGKLKVSTQPYIYNKNLLSNLIDPAAYEALHYNHEIRYSQQEHIGSLKYLSIYAPILQTNGETQAYINIPYLNSQAELNQEISGFLATLINLNAFIFLIAGAIAFLITNQITASFRLIGEKMEQVNFGKENEEIEWNRQDEIGVLVNEYNKMVKKLEASAKALAQSEREGAWREMARQVAHEIKNPLTPMKLSIQYLQRSIKNNTANIQQLSQQVATTLIEQIEQLSKIAGDFSQFANIGNTTVEKFDVSEIIQQVICLYETDDKIKITWKKDEGNYFIESDKIQINRLFTNLFKNAVEASNENDVIEINITQQNQNNKILIAVSDNGKGINDDEKNKIFTPNFTTKSSGTGLGLAICKGIVEHANGNIRFEKNKTKGTIFYVELPMSN